MATNYTLSPVHAINKYLWDAIQDAGFMNPANYGSLVPIIPTQQIPEMNAMIAAGKSVPFIVYTYRTNAISEDWFIQDDSIVYVIYSQNQSDLIKINNLMVDIFKRWDESGQAVQDYIDTLNHPVLKQYDIKSVSVDSAGGPDPQSEENGRMTAIVTIRVTYTVD